MYNKSWLTRRHYFSVVNSLERFTSRRWSEEDYKTHLSEHKKIGLVFSPKDNDDGLVAAIVYKLHRNKIVVGHMVIHPEFDGVIGRIIEEMDMKLSNGRRYEYKFFVPERDLFVQRALREFNIPCVGQKNGDYVFSKKLLSQEK